jgi:D-beta-D-heptose 7-phosphate kinase/D-beta-D-heptose 1-phosphate adenosyltransferase
MRKIWTNGCFDVLHIGHIKLLEFAKSQGDYLIVGIDSDERILETKGLGRPINNQKNRLEFLKAIEAVDEVIIFNSSEGLLNAIEFNQIDLIVVGDDYKEKSVIGSQISPVLFFEKIQAISTSLIIEKIINHRNI